MRLRALRFGHRQPQNAVLIGCFRPFRVQLRRESESPAEISVVALGVITGLLFLLALLFSLTGYRHLTVADLDLDIVLRDSRKIEDHRVCLIALLDVASRGNTHLVLPA